MAKSTIVSGTRIAMRYAADHKARTRRQLLAKAGQLAKQQGFASTGVDQMMAAAGLTSGAFYAHFGSKAEMLEALIEQELAASAKLFDQVEGKGVEALAAAYLSLAHVEHPEAGCALPALSAEVARADGAVRASFERSLLKIHARMAEMVGNEAQAWAVLAQSVGAVLLARAMQTKKSRKAVLDGARQTLEAAQRD